MDNKTNQQKRHFTEAQKQEFEEGKTTNEETDTETDAEPDLLKRRGIYLLPNLFTVGSLFAGFYAIVAALKGVYDNAAISIFIAMVMDGIDGRVARLTNTVTAFGAELDSLSDMVSFGIAPALVMYSWALSNLGKIGWLAAFIYAAATALRLARFNTQLNKGDKHYFQGLSSTAAAAAMASVVWLGRDLEIPPHSFSILLAAVTTALGILMVSNIRYRSFKDIDLKSNVRFVVILVMVVILVLISIDPSKVLFAICFIYACSGPIETIWGMHRRRKKRKAMHLSHVNKNTSNSRARRDELPRPETRD